MDLPRREVRTLLDPVRGKRVAWTPEEEVRQGLLRLLLGPVGIPATCLKVELSLNGLDARVRDRVDVVAFHREVPVLLCECKAPGIALDADVSAQLRRYLRLLPASWVLATNGHQFRLHAFKDGLWQERQELSSWEAMKPPA